MIRKLIAAILAAAVCLSLSAPAVAASTSIDDRVEKLEEKYGINIQYGVDENGKPIINNGNLNMFDASLGTVTSNVVKQVSAYHQKKVGKRLTYNFTYDTIKTNNANLLVLGYFDQTTATINICMPTTKGALTTGCAPITIVHEFAHAYHVMAEEQYGKDKMKREWMALNGNVSNNEGYMVYPYDKSVFISSYAASSYEEDFADTFAHALVRNKEGQGFHHRMIIGEKKTSIWKKVNYIENLLPKYITGSDKVVSNLRKAYTTPVTLTYQGMRFSDEEMQFIGYAQPKYVLKAVLSAHKLNATDSQWIKEIGGWYVTDRSGKYYIAYPGGKCYELEGKLRVAA